MDIEKTVLSVLTNESKPMKAGEIAIASGIDKAQVDKAIKKLKTEGRIHSPRVCYYEPKK